MDNMIRIAKDEKKKDEIDGEKASVLLFDSSDNKSVDLLDFMFQAPGFAKLVETRLETSKTPMFAFVEAMEEWFTSIVGHVKGLAETLEKVEELGGELPNPDKLEAKETKVDEGKESEKKAWVLRNCKFAAATQSAQGVQL